MKVSCRFRMPTYHNRSDSLKMKEFLCILRICAVHRRVRHRRLIYILSVTEPKSARTLLSLPQFPITAKCCWCLRLGLLIGLARTGSVDRCHGDSVLPPCERPLGYLPRYLLVLTMKQPLAFAIYVKSSGISHDMSYEMKVTAGKRYNQDE